MKLKKLKVHLTKSLVLAEPSETFCGTLRFRESWLKNPEIDHGRLKLKRESNLDIKNIYKALIQMLFTS